MRIVILDGHTLNPGDLSWVELQALGDCDIHERTSPSEIVDRSQGAEILLTNKTILDKDIITQLPNLKYIGILATGYNIVDVDAAAQRGIPGELATILERRTVHRLRGPGWSLMGVLT